MDATNSISFSDFELEEQQALELATAPSRKLDHLLTVQFYKHAELNAVRSAAEGRKIFEEFVYIRIQAPANRFNIIEKRATDEDKLRFATHYARFLKGATQLVAGTPITELPTITKALEMEFNHFGIFTIEQLAGAPDSTVQILGTGGGELKRRAQAFLDRTANANAQGEQIRALQAELAALRAQMQKTEEAEKVEEVRVTEGGAVKPR